MRRRVHVYEHADHGPALALAPVLAAAGRLFGEPGLLQHEPGPGVRELEAVPLGRDLVEVLDREIRVSLSAKATQLRDRRDRDPLADQPPTTAVAHRVAAAVLVTLLEAPHMAWADAQDRRGLHPADVARQRLHDNVAPSHRLELLGDPAFAGGHACQPAERLAEADIYECS